MSWCFHPLECSVDIYAPFRGKREKNTNSSAQWAHLLIWMSAVKGLMSPKLLEFQFLSTCTFYSSLHGIHYSRLIFFCLPVWSCHAGIFNGHELFNSFYLIWKCRCRDSAEMSKYYDGRQFIYFNFFSHNAWGHDKDRTDRGSFIMLWVEFFWWLLDDRTG